MVKSTAQADPCFTGPIALLLAHLPPEMIAEAMPMVIAELRMDARKLALLLTRAINPDHVFGEGQEAVIRSVDRKTLRAMKEGKELPISMSA